LISLTTPVQAINGTLLRGDTKTQKHKNTNLFMGSYSVVETGE